MEVPYGYKMHNDKLVPDYAVARSVEVAVVLKKLGIAELREVDGKNGREFKGMCPFGAEHGKDGSFSVNKELGKFMCHACKRSGSHVLRFVELVMETQPEVDYFGAAEIDGDWSTGTQAAARWLISLVEPAKNAEREKSASGMQESVPTAYGRAKAEVFMAFVVGPLWKMLHEDDNPVALAESVTREIRDIARVVAEERGESNEA